MRTNKDSLCPRIAPLFHGSFHFGTGPLITVPKINACSWYLEPYLLVTRYSFVSLLTWYLLVAQQRGTCCCSTRPPQDPFTIISFRIFVSKLLLSCLGMEEMEDAHPHTRSKIKKEKYRLLKSDCDAPWDSGGGTAAVASIRTGVSSGGNQAQQVNRCSGWLESRGTSSEEERTREMPERPRQMDVGTKRSPSDPFKPIKLKMIPRNVQVSRSVSTSGPSGGTNGGGTHHVATRSPSVPCTSATGACPLTGMTRTTHTAVVHSSGAHSLLRNPPPFLPPQQQGSQTPTSFPSMVLRCGRRCSSPQTPMLTGCLPYVSRMPPRSAQTSPSAPKSPKLTSSNSDPWSAIITKNYRAQSVGGCIPPGEMDWLPAPSPCSRKSSWSSVSTDNDSSSSCWFEEHHSRHGKR
ncbi:uncharacterized protein LOC121873134 [Homarus americanus]|uniref:uncharacterized protein LOC121873134 n=1 Tax=Homarus americanus TaxID=6706 RepID=UPI001C448741|nr:uncharacterized protein LOC121873134 [Homarus americanus]